MSDRPTLDLVPVLRTAGTAVVPLFTAGGRAGALHAEIAAFARPWPHPAHA